MDSLKTQIGGDHYRRWKIQPVEFWMRNGWDGCAGSALKYICRHDAKDGPQALHKARHFGQLRVDLIRMAPHVMYSLAGYVIQMTEFVERNQIVVEAPTLIALDQWVRGEDGNGEQYFIELHKLHATVYGNN